MRRVFCSMIVTISCILCTVPALAFENVDSLRSDYLQEKGKRKKKKTVSQNSPALTVDKSGSVGPKGEKGDKGDRGEEGAVGATGATGPAGLIGETGPKGTVGSRGQVGPRGPQGAIGPKGELGVPGKGIQPSFIEAYIAHEREVTADSTVPFNSAGICSKDMSFDSSQHSFKIGALGRYRIFFTAKVSTKLQVNGMTVNINGEIYPLHSTNFMFTGQKKGVNYVILHGETIYDLPANASVCFVINATAKPKEAPEFIYQDLYFLDSSSAYVSITKIADMDA